MKATQFSTAFAKPRLHAPSEYRCRICNSLERKDNEWSDETYRYPLSGRARKMPIAELLYAFDSQCQFCAIVLEGVWMIAERLRLRYQRDYLHEDFRWIVVEYGIPIKEDEKVRVAYVPVDHSKDENEYVWEHWWGKRWYFELKEKGTTLPLSMLGVAKAPAMTLDSAALKIESWLAECLQKHDDPCKSGADMLSPKFTPTRLLEIGHTNSDIRLVETRARTMAYTALSYCWGQTPTSLTDHSNYQDRLARVSWQSIPQLHQDAIKLTRKLGIQHIWIDAFCIIQHDADDWQKESAKMAEVYGNSVLVISAAHAGSVSQSLVPEILPTIVPDYVGRRKDDPLQVLAWKSIPHKLAWSPPRKNVDWPMLTRAWTFQERLLARRCVHFGTRELLWECSSLKSCECGFLDSDPKQSLRYAIDQLRKCADWDAREKVFVYSWTWMYVVRQFSGRKLSQETDRLIAISGLTTKFEGAGLGRYVAGLWEEDFLQGLLWAPHVDAGCYRPLKRIAPSWSWASVVGEVWYNTVDRAKSAYHATVFDIQYDSVVGPASTIKVRGPMIDIQFDPEVKMPVRTDDMLLRSKWDLDICDGDRAGELEAGDEVKCAFVFSFKSQYSKCAMALILRRSEGRGDLYQRVGILNVYPWEDTLVGMDGVREWLSTLAEDVAVIE